MLNQYVYHSMLLCLLGRHECKNILNEAFLSDINTVMTERDYAKALKADFDMEMKT